MLGIVGEGQESLLGFFYLLGDEEVGQGCELQ